MIMLTRHRTSFAVHLNMRKRFTLLLWLAPFVHASAQTRSFGGCWLRPAPLPACSSFLVTEASAEFRLNRRVNESSPRFMLGVGFMRGVNTASSVGGIVAWDVGRGWSPPARAELRYRRWLTTTALDFSAGVTHRGLIPPSGNGELGRAWGPTLGAGVEWKYVALDTRADLLRGAGQTRADAYVGARTTSVGAPIAVLAGLALIVAVVSQVDY
jgi:hypothetical protein